MWPLTNGIAAHFLGLPTVTVPTTRLTGQAAVPIMLVWLHLSSRNVPSNTVSENPTADILENPFQMIAKPRPDNPSHELRAAEQRS